MQKLECLPEFSALNRTCRALERVSGRARRHVASNCLRPSCLEQVVADRSADMHSMAARWHAQQPIYVSRNRDRWDPLADKPTHSLCAVQSVTPTAETQMQTLVAVYPSRAEAEQMKRKLVGAGISQ